MNIQEHSRSFNPESSLTFKITCECTGIQDLNVFNSIFLYLEKIKQYFARICFNSFYFTLNVYVIKGFTSNFNHISS